MATVVVDEQGKRCDIQEVSNGQVEHIDVVSGETGPSSPYLQYDDGIQREPQQQGEGVDSGQQNAFEVLLVGAAGVGITGICMCEGFTARKAQKGPGDDCFCEEGAKMS